MEWNSISVRNALFRLSGVGAFVCLVVLFNASCGEAAEKVTASSSVAGYQAGGAANGNRFSLEHGSVWQGATNSGRWWWQVEFERPRAVGAILQVVGDHPFVFRNAPRRSVWLRSEDGVNWSDLSETAFTNEHRLFRIHRLARAVTARFLRLDITAVAGTFPTLREVEFYSDPQAPVMFPDWIVVVNATHDPKLPNHGQEFIPLAKRVYEDPYSRRSRGNETQSFRTNPRAAEDQSLVTSTATSSIPSRKPGGRELEMQAQQVWLDVFNEEFLKVEPRPLCAFLSGSFKDWCEVDRETWRGAQEVLRNKSLPMWASCGGAQGLAIVAETGVDKPWDCPHCRDAKNPKAPIYTHIGHTAQRACGDYSGCVFERGPHWVRAVTDDPVFTNLPREFQVMESHCGQIEWPPVGWSLIATAGAGTKTKTQCLRMNDRPIYAAQFHIEMDGTPEASKQIMANFLALAKAWGGYNPKGLSLPAPRP